MKKRKRALQEPGQHSSVSNGSPPRQLLPSGMTSYLEYWEALRSGISTLHQRYSWVLTSKGTRQEYSLLKRLQRRTKMELWGRILTWQVSGLLRRVQHHLRKNTEREGDSWRLRGSEIKDLGQCSIGLLPSDSVLDAEMSIVHLLYEHKTCFLTVSVILGSPVDKLF